jgi:pimeloyl-ACP methyl ester carboxylesterase
MSFAKAGMDLLAGRVAYFVAGDGPPILYLHAAGGIRLTGALDDLARDFRVYSPVIPGFDGEPVLAGVDSMPSLADLMAEFIEQAIGSDCAVVRQAFGAWAGAWITVRHPRKVAKLVLECPNGFRPDDAPPRSTDPVLMRRQMYAHPENLPPETKTRETLIANARVQHRYDGNMLRDDALIARLGTISCPSMVVMGSLDGRNPPGSARLAKRAIPGAVLAFIDDAAHNVEVDQRARFVALLQAFLRSKPAAPFTPPPGAPDISLEP